MVCIDGMQMNVGLLMIHAAMRHVCAADSSVGLQVNLMTSFNSASFPDSLAIAKESGLTIGSIDEIQKLHIRAVPMGEQARRLAHQDSSHTFLVTTSSEPSGAPCYQTPH